MTVRLIRPNTYTDSVAELRKKLILMLSPSLKQRSAIGVSCSGVAALSWLLSTSVPKMDVFPLMLSTFSYVYGIRIGGMRKFFVLDSSHEALSSFYYSPWRVGSILGVESARKPQYM